MLLPILPLMFLTWVEPADRSAEIPVLIRQLGDDRRTARDEASARLENIGRDALPALRTALTSRDPEIRRRARRILFRIERRLYHLERTFEAKAGSVNCVLFHPDGKHAYSGDGHAVRKWDLTTGKQVGMADDHGDRIVGLELSPDRKMLVTTSDDRSVRLRDAITLKEIRRLKHHRKSVRCARFLSGGKQLLTAGLDGKFVRWDLATGKVLRSWDITPCLSMSVVPSEDTVAAGCGGKNKVVELDGGDRVSENYPGHDKDITAVCFSADGKQLLTGSLDQTLRLWDTKSKKCLLILKGHTGSITDVALSPTGKWAVSVGLDKVLRIWDLQSGRSIREMTGHTQAIWSVAISADGSRVLTGSHDGTMRLWRVTP